MGPGQLEVDGDSVVEEVMEIGPSTLRPDVTLSNGGPQGFFEVVALRRTSGNPSHCRNSAGGESQELPAPESGPEPGFRRTNLRHHPYMPYRQ